MIATALNMGWELARILLILILLAPLVYLASRLYGGRALNNNRSLQVIESLSLGGRRSLVIVRVGQRNLLLGVTDGNIQLLSDVSDLDLKKSTEQFSSLVRDFWPRRKGDNDESK